MPEVRALQMLPEDWERGLAIVAHPDDLEYGASSAIARWTSQGKIVTYLMVTRGEAGIDSISPDKAGPLREAEQRNSAKVVGVDVVEFLGYRDGVIEYGLPLRRDITAVIRKHTPDILITGNYQLTWPDGTLNMADHRWVGLAVLDAARDAGNRWIFPELSKKGLEPTDTVKSVLIAGSANSTHGVDVTDHIAKGVASLEEHRVYIDNLESTFDPDMFLRMTANAVGQRLGCDYGVDFQVVNI